MYIYTLYVYQLYGSLIVSLTMIVSYSLFVFLSLC